jgi:hypothetical protein
LTLALRQTRALGRQAGLRLGITCALLFGGGRAQAQHTDPPNTRGKPSAPAASRTELPSTEAARDAFHQGAALANAGRWEEASESFEESYELRPHPVTTYNIAYCERALGRSTQALAIFRRALEEHASRRHGELPAQLVGLANTYGSEAQRRIARVRIVVESLDSRILVDARPLEAFVDEHRSKTVQIAGRREPGAARPVPALEFEVWVDPGLRLFTLQRAGRPEVLVARHLAPGATDRIALSAPRLEPARRPIDDFRRRERPGIQREWAFVALGVGAAGLVAGSVAGYQALRKQALLDDECGPSGKQCPETRGGDIDSLKRAADGATLGFAVALAGAAVGIVLLGVFPERTATERAPAARQYPRMRANELAAFGRF